MFFLSGCVKTYKILNPQQRFINYLQKNTKGELLYIFCKGKIEIFNEFNFKGIFKFEADSIKKNLFIFSPFGTFKDRIKSDTLFHLLKTFFEPLKYYGYLKVIKGYRKDKSEIFELENKIKIFFDDNKRIKEFSLPDYRFSIVWKDTLPYNIKIKGEDFYMNITLNEIKFKFKR